MLPRIMTVPSIGKKLFNWRWVFFAMLESNRSNLRCQTKRG
jgi:hypothetical protein